MVYVILGSPLTAVFQAAPLLLIWGGDSRIGAVITTTRKLIDTIHTGLS
jgi:hypothetical protein